MKIEPLPAILDAVERGRGERGGSGARLTLGRGAVLHAVNRWSYIRAVVLTLLSEGWSQRAIAEELQVCRQWAGQLAAEACDAVVRTAPRSPEADAACAPTWCWWCDQRGDADACGRL